MRNTDDALTLALALEREKRANVIKSNFLRGISHDLRAPAGTVTEAVRQAKTHVYEPRRLQSDLERMEIAAQRLARLADSMLDMSAAESGRSSVHSEPCNLTAQLRDAMERFRPQAEGKGVQFAAAFELPEEEVLADARGFYSVICALLSNAVRFTPENGVVKLNARQGQVSEAGYAQYEFVVSDTGAGMAPEQLRELREALDRDGSDEGSASGLSTAKRLLSIMGGAMEIQSKEGKGTSVGICIPFKLAAHSRKAQFDSAFDLFSLSSGEDPIYLYDYHTRAVRFSPALLDLIGTPDERFSGVDGLYSWMDAIHPDDREAFMRAVWEAGELRRTVFSLRCRMRFQSGAYTSVRLLGSVTRDPGGQPNFLGLLLRSGDLSKAVDPVTGLPNRHRFFAELQQPASGAAGRPVLLIRLGRLDRIRAEYGCASGNEVLRRAGTEIQSAVEENGVVYRLEDAGFAVVSRLPDRERMETLYETLRGTLGRAAEAGGIPLWLPVSGALLIRSQGCELNEKEVYEVLSAACGESERTQRGGLVTMFESAEKVPRALTRRLIHCMEREFEGFFLRYQPVFDPDGGIPAGAEALLRWRDGDKELTPGEFLSGIEEGNGFRELGRWILRGALQDGKLFLETRPDFTVTVNISPHQVTDPLFSETLTALAEEAGFPLDRLCVELGRDCRLLPAETLHAFLAPLRALGTQIGIDDFGSGSAWLDAVRDPDVDYVKFSGVFARDAAESEAGCGAAKHLAELARAYGKKVYFKAVASQEMADALRPLPVHGVQGWYYSEPLFFDEVAELLSNT